jgi:aerobic-type carbon monoxide dehydrogenase small subunit (CoxS/CutS family)
MANLTINGTSYGLDVEADMPLLWALRDELGLTGTKFGCGVGLCGACTVHLDGRAVRSCVVPVSAAAGKAVTTIEGLSEDGKAHPLQRAWIAEQVPQCGYCQSGQIMAAAAFLTENPNPDNAAIRAGMTTLCRCGTYLRIHAAIKRAAAESSGTST